MYADTLTTRLPVRMKRIYIVAFLMLLCTTADAQIMAKLKEIGMENIRCVQTPETTTVAFENNVYRGDRKSVV